jgi:hypothetical protein
MGPVELSACCGTFIDIDGEPGETQFWRCRACKRPCDLLSSLPVIDVDYYAEKSAEDARRQARRIVDAVMAGEPDKVYLFTMSFEEADETSMEHGGETISGRTAETLNPDG